MQTGKDNAETATEKKRKKISTLPAFIAAIILISGIICYILNKLNIIRYDEITANLGLSDKRIIETLDTDNKLYVHFIDVGQGDCILIQSERYNFLIDSGESEYSAKVLNYLKQNEVNELDLLVATHPHSDHIGAMPDIINNIEIKQIIMPEIPNELLVGNTEYSDLKNVLTLNNIKPMFVKSGEEYKFGEYLNLYIYSPVKEYKENINNYSVVMKMTYKDSAFLFTGDAEEEAEMDIMKEKSDLSADVMKVGHHGSNTSTKHKFIKKVNPQYCVISCGLGNRFNHPQSEVIDEIKNFTSNIYRTDLDGTVICVTDGSTYEFICENDK